MDFKNLPLGQKTTYVRSYDSSLLVSLNREDARKRVGVDLNPDSFYGLDCWTAYELSWLNSSGVPQNHRINFCFSNPSCYQLRILRTKIQDYD